MVSCGNDLFFPPDCYCKQLPWFAFQVRNAPGVALRTVLQLANRIITYMQNALKRFCSFFSFTPSVKIWKPLINTTFGRFVWGNYNSVRDVPLEDFGSWTHSALFLIPELQIFTEAPFAQSYDTICTFFYLWVRGKKLRCEELKGSSEADTAKRTEVNKGLPIPHAEPLRATLAHACFYCETFLPWQNGGNRDQSNGGKCIYDYQITLNLFLSCCSLCCEWRSSVTIFLKKTSCIAVLLGNFSFHNQTKFRWLSIT